jgi:hypothetical protein
VLLTPLNGKEYYHITNMTSYELSRLHTWDKTGLLEEFHSLEEKLDKALKLENWTKVMIATKWGH